jgi:HlyD family secretion protein
MLRTQSIFSLILLLSVGLVSCNPNRQAASSGGPGGGRGGPPGKSDQPVTVEVLTAKAGSLGDSNTYTGTTEPRQQVNLRSQITAQLLDLTVDVGDSVTAGQVIAQLDATSLRAAVQQAEAELAVRAVALAQARTARAEAQTTVDRAAAELQQAEADAARARSLAQRGAISQQEAELAQTALEIAEQTLRSTQAQARTQTQAIAAAQQQIAAQQAAVDQQREQLSFATLIAPVSGAVLAKQAEAGNLLQAGEEVITLGNLQDTQVIIQVTDQARAQVRIGQRVSVQLDAFPNRLFAGEVDRISPVADAASRLIAVKITLETTEPLGSGLLARVNLNGAGGSSVVVPASAVQVGPSSDQGIVFVVAESAAGNGAEGGAEEGTEKGAKGAEGDAENTVETVADSPKVEAKSVRIGRASNGQIEIVSGLLPGDRYVANSDQPLTDGQTVRRSLTSES